MSLGSRAMEDQPFGFATRLGRGAGTDPEELAAAAHAACFSMALGMVLRAGGLGEPVIEARSTVTLGRREGGPAVTGAHLAVRVVAPGADAAVVREACAVARDNCPISRLYDTEVTMEVEVVTARPELAPRDADAVRSRPRVAAE